MKMKMKIRSRIVLDKGIYKENSNLDYFKVKAIWRMTAEVL